MLRLAIPVVTLALTGGAVRAAEAPLDRARQCAAIQDSLQRLVCYDRVFTPGVSAEPSPVPAAPSASAPPPAPPAPAAQAGTDTARFGAETLKRSDAEREREAPPSSITATVRELRETRPNVFRVSLDNGQIWQQMDMDSLFTLAVGDTVQIDRGRLGGYRMSRTSKGGSGWVRVNRLK
jgi:hypothetical protein